MPRTEVQTLQLLLAYKRFQQEAQALFQEELKFATLTAAALTPDQRRGIRQDFDYTKRNTALANALNEIIDATAPITPRQRILVLARARLALRKTLSDSTTHLATRLLENPTLSFNEAFQIQFAPNRLSHILDTIAHQVQEDTAHQANSQAHSKIWICTFDNSREPHQEAHKQVRLLTEPFTVGGEQAEFPGDPKLSLQNKINCHCYVEYRT